jgi:hypothetical protein
MPSEKLLEVTGWDSKLTIYSGEEGHLLLPLK